MKFALVNGVKTFAAKGIQGICPICGSELIAKCGEVKVNHWAHKGNPVCDTWWENETEWHRTWKEFFPVDWQEVIQFDDKGEKHIADIRTNYGLILEFQHSHMDPNEQKLRENFYKNMIWVVDGMRLKRDYSRLIKGKQYFQKVNQSLYKIADVEEFLPLAWLTSRVPVIFDFNNLYSTSNSENINEPLFCLYPIRIGRYAIVEVLTKSVLINGIINGELKIHLAANLKNIYQVNIEYQNQVELNRRSQINQQYNRYPRRNKRL